MSLADYQSPYFKAGERYTVTIKGLSFNKCNSGSEAVSFKIGDGSREGKVDCVIHKNAMWKICNLAEACGMTVEEMRKFDEKRHNSYQWFVGKRFVATFDKVASRNDPDKAYTEVVDFAAVGSPMPSPPSSRTTQKPADEPYTKPGYSDQTTEPESQTVPAYDADIPF